jgi:hypothetical protein
MKLSPPKQVTFYVSVILAVLGVLGKFVALPIVSAYSFWILLIGFVLLALGNMSVGL